MKRFRFVALTLALVIGAYSASSAQMRIDGIPAILRVVTKALFPDGSLSAPSIAFQNDTTLGLGRRTTLVMDVHANGGYLAEFDGANVLFKLRALAPLCWTSNQADTTCDTFIYRGGAGLFNFTDTDGTPDVNLNVAGSPAVSSCGDGAISTGSSNTSGRVTSTNATACTLTFSTSFGGNSADCVIANLIANRGFVSAASATAFTVSSLTAGDDFMYWCAGR